MTEADPFNLERFVTAQAPSHVWGLIGNTILHGTGSAIQSYRAAAGPTSPT